MPEQELFNGTPKTTIENDENLAFNKDGQIGALNITWSNFKNFLANSFMRLTGNQSVDGVKSFNTSPVVPDPSKDFEVVNLRTLLSTALIGPESSIDENIVAFDGVGGNVIKDSGESLKGILGRAGTSTVYGLETSINGGDNAKFDVAAGLGIVADNYTDAETPVITLVPKETATTAITITNLATQDFTFVGLNSSGTFIQQASLFTTEDRRDIITIAAIAHPSRTQIDNISGIKIWNKDYILAINDLGVALGTSINLSGNIYSANGANLKIDRSAGDTYSQGGNYDIAKKDTNHIDSIRELALPFFLLKSNSVGTTTDTIPVNQYEPGKDGTLVNLTDNYFTVHRIYWEPVTGINAIQYGQFEYDSQKKAVEAWEKECNTKADILTEVQLRGAIIVRKGTTALNDDDDVKFVEAAALGDKVLSETPTFSRFAENIEIIDGMSYQRQSITYVNDGGVLYADIEAVGTGNITYAFAQKEYVLDCITGSGVGGRARVALIAGTAFDDPEKTFIYVTRNGDVAQLNASITKPTGQFANIGEVLMPDATTFNTTGPYSAQRTSDDKSHDGRGALPYEREKIRDLGVTYDSGIIPTITITDLAVDTLDVLFTGGVVKQLHELSIPALASATDGIYIINHPTTPYLRVTDLETITIDAAGNSLNNTAFNHVYIGIGNSADGVNYSKIGVLLPNGSYGYTDLQNALQDPSNTAVTSVPQELKRTAFLIARVTYKLKNNILNNVVEDILTPQTFFDLRGNLLGANAGGVGAPSVSSFIDNVFSIISNVSGFTLSWVLNNLTAIRTVTWPDISGLVAIFGMLNPFKFGSQAWSAEKVQAWSASVTYNFDNGNLQSSVATSSATLAISNKQLGGAYTMDILVDATGGYIFTFNSSFGTVSSNGLSSPVSASADERYTISILETSNGTKTIITKD